MWHGVRRVCCGIGMRSAFIGQTTPCMSWNFGVRRVTRHGVLRVPSHVHAGWLCAVPSQANASALKIAIIGPHGNSTQAFLSAPDYHGDNTLVNKHSPVEARAPPRTRVC